MLSPIGIYRLSHFLWEKRIPFLPRILSYLNFVLFKLHLPAQTRLGKHVIFSHGGMASVINGRCVVGDNCVIGTCVTIGGGKNGVPQIGNNVYIATGAKVIGGIVVGDNVVIGANAVVVNDVAPNTCVAGVPAKVIKENININDYIRIR